MIKAWILQTYKGRGQCNDRYTLTDYFLICTYWYLFVRTHLYSIWEICIRDERCCIQKWAWRLLLHTNPCVTNVVAYKSLRDDCRCIQIFAWRLSLHTNICVTIVIAYKYLRDDCHCIQIFVVWSKSNNVITIISNYNI